MSVQLDPIIAEKLEDFRRRRRNLIILRGICTAIVTLLGVFSTIAIADYLSQARMPDELRTTLSYLGYAVVVLAVWRTCARLLLELPSRRKLARLIEQTAPELREDLLSAVELGREEGVESDSEIFRKLVQKDVSSRVRTLDMTSTLPLARLRKWLIATAGLIALTLPRSSCYSSDARGIRTRAAQTMAARVTRRCDSSRRALADVASNPTGGKPHLA